jgi:CheY-like chemotaxis protein
MTSGSLARPRGQSPVDLMRSQLEAIDAWHRARRAAESAALSAMNTRENRLGPQPPPRGAPARAAGAGGRAADQLRASGGVLAGRLRPGGPWWPPQPLAAGHGAGRLREEGVEVVGAVRRRSGLRRHLVVEQPDLLLVEDRLPTLTGVEVVQRARDFSPRTVVGAQALDAGSVAALFDAGAKAVFARRVPPVEMVDQLLVCLDGGRQAEDSRG